MIIFFNANLCFTYVWLIFFMRIDSFFTRHRGYYCGKADMADMDDLANLSGP
jgi:hypothetical protein